MTDMTAMSEMASPEKSARAEVRPSIPSPATRPVLPPGKEAPDFSLEKVTSGTASLAAYRGKVLVLVFGNYSSPSFRQRVVELEQVKREYTRRGVECLIIYTREVHAVGEWEVERNKDARVAVEQPTTLADRKALAKQARETLNITIPIAIDTIDDKTAKDYDGFTNACVVVGRDGLVVARQTWFNSDTLRSQLDAIVAR
jgi:peroxiredoxin